MASPSNATPSAVAPSGNPLASESAQSPENSSNAGPQLKPKDGAPGPQGGSTNTAMLSGRIAARVVNSKRPEVEAFLLGFKLCWDSICTILPPNAESDNRLFQIAAQAALDLYPDYDPPPPPVKRTEDGRRSDGIEMENS